jgi:hypothetical protein
MGTLLEAIGIVLETHFRFEFPNESPVGDDMNFLSLVII